MNKAEISPPPTPPRSQAHGGGRTSPPQKKKLHILITDDEEEIREILLNGLKIYDDKFILSSATTGCEALHFIENNPVDILVTDVAMPDMDGFELFTKVKEIRPDLPIIMMTGFGYDPSHTLVKAKKSGMIDILYKPFNVENLYIKIKHYELGIRNSELG